MLRWLLPVLIGAVVLLAAAPGAALADLVDVATVNGTIEDATATRVLYKTPDQQWKVKDTAGAGSDRVITLPSFHTAGVNVHGRLVPGGALVAGGDGNLYADNETLYEWRSADDSVTDLGPVNFNSIRAAGNYAIWLNNGVHLWDAATDSEQTVATGSIGEVDVAANGDVVYSKYNGSDRDDVFRWRAGNTTQLTPGVFGDNSRFPLTDGNLTVYRRSGPPSAVQGSIFFTDGTAPEAQLEDSLHQTNFATFQDYRVAGGWIAYPRAGNTQVWTRTQAGQYEQVPSPAPDQQIFIRAVNADGQVVYERNTGDQTQNDPWSGSEGLFLGTPGADDAFPIETKARNSFQFGWDAFFANDHWYIVRPNELLRLDLDTAITQRPPVATSTRAATFRFASTAGTPQYTCALDGAPPVTCTSPYTTEPLADGTHTLSVTSKDLATGDEDATAASATWTVDTTPPDAFALNRPADGTATDDPAPTLSWQPASDAQSGVTGYDVYIDDNLAAANVATTSFTPDSSHHLADGSHTWHVVARNGAGLTRDSGTINFIVDTVPPTRPGQISPPRDATVTTARPTFSWTASSDAGTGLAGYDVEIDFVATRVDPGATSYTPSSDLADGAHTWRVTAVDGEGNRTASQVLDFTVDTRAPSASLAATPNPALEGDSVQFSAAATTAGATAITRYEWDLDGDGVYERDTGTDPTVTTTYGSPLDVTVSVRVTDAAGRSDTKQLAVAVTPAPLPGPPGVSINDGARFTNNRHVTLTARWPKYATSMLIANDGGFDGAEPSGLHAHPKWKLASSGKERLPTTVYVRFSGGLAGNETYQDDIILDLTDPVLVSASAQPAAKRGVRLRLRAHDGISGIKSVQFGRNKKHPGPYVRFRPTISLSSSRAPDWARVIDRAGNHSGWKRVARG